MNTKHQQFKLPPLTVTWKEVEEAWDNTGTKMEGGGHLFTISDFIDSKAADIQETFFSERLVYNPDIDVLHVRFSYDYEVDTERITKPMQLLSWTEHLSNKTWMNRDFLGEFIKKVCEIKGWDLHR